MKDYRINIVCILILIAVLYYTKEVRDEGFFVKPYTNSEAFGMSPGTMDQLSSTRVSKKML